MWWGRRDNNGENRPSSEGGPRASNRKDITANNNSNSTVVPTKATLSSAFRNRKLWINGRNPAIEQDDPYAGNRGSKPVVAVDMMLVAETSSGIEISLSDENDASQLNSTGNSISIYHQNNNLNHFDSTFSTQVLLQRPLQQEDGVSTVRAHLVASQHVYRAQFSVSGEWIDRTQSSDAITTNGVNTSLMPATSQMGSAANATATATVFQPGRHRLPFVGVGGRRGAPPRGGNRAKLLFDDMLNLLRDHEIVDEASCVREEIALLDAEIQAIDHDREQLEKKCVHLPPSVAMPLIEWDIHQLLTKKDLPQPRRAALQEERGLSFTVVMSSDHTVQEAFLLKCGCKASTVRSYYGGRRATSPPSLQLEDSSVDVKPDNCREGGAAMTIQHLALLPGEIDGSTNGGIGKFGVGVRSTTSNTSLSFFISRDSGKSYYHGILPDQLLRRMRTAGLDPNQQASDLAYLSTGPLGAYYCQFRSSGECWWGYPGVEHDFNAICRDWDVYRVAFGPSTLFEDSSSDKKLLISSWIILGRDGRAAWKNLPARLHRTLESRLANESAPTEISLGYGGSYFVRFLDGSVDYCLPATIAKRIDERELKVTSVILHPDLPHDYIVRHR